MEKRYWIIYFQGAEAVKAGYAYQQNHCYRRILHNGEYAGQLEVVRDDEESQLVAVSYIPEDQVEFVKAELAKNGFAGTHYIPESYSDEDCYWGWREEEEGTLPDYSETLVRELLPEPTVTKSVISISATVHEEEGEWIDWWIDCDDPNVCLPYDRDECEKYLRKYNIILVGNKWFSGIDADKAIKECFRQYKKITIINDDDEVVAEIYDKQTIYDPTEDFGKYRWMSQTYGNVEHTFADVLEGAEEGETYKHNYKGW